MPALPEVMRIPEVEPPSPAPLISAPAEALAGVPQPAEPQVAEPTPEPDAEPDPAETPDVMGEIARLRAMALARWRDHLERTVATGQAVMACGSPQAAARLQTAYLHASLASGLAQMGELARSWTRIARGGSHGA